MSTLRGRSYLKEADFDRAELAELLELAAELRKERTAGGRGHRLAGRNIALIFEKTSTRTRAAFEVAAHEEGAAVTFLGPGETQLGEKESIRDTARVLGRMYDGIEYRGFGQDRVEELASFAGVPVWNGLTDEWHPTQSLADIFTMRDHCDKPLEEVSCCYLGDARNNTANSLLVASAIFGLDIRLGAPEDLLPSKEVSELAARLANTSGARITLTSDPALALSGADFVYTDVWLSMGEPSELWGERIRKLRPYQVDSAALAATGKENVRFMHCLPALHDENTGIGRRLAAEYGLGSLEVTDDVFESPASIVFDQAENRLHTIKAVMVATLGL